MSLDYRMAQFKNKYSKKARMRIFCCFLVLIGMVLISIRSIGTAIINTVETRQRLKDRSNELIRAEEENKVLMHDLEKIEDPEYISQYIRDDYYYIAEGEVFFVLPEEEVEDESTSNN